MADTILTSSDVAGAAARYRAKRDARIARRQTRRSGARTPQQIAAGQARIAGHVAHNARLIQLDAAGDVVAAQIIAGGR